MQPRSQSVYQNYQDFEAWEQMPEQSHCNLLQRLNKNLSSYENKYKKYMMNKANQLRQYGKLTTYLEVKQKQNQNVPFLPLIKADHNFIVQSQTIPKQKVFISQQKETKDDQIFCDRANNQMRMKTISFQKPSKSRHRIQRRKLSLNQQKQSQAEKYFFKVKVHQEKQNVDESPFKIDLGNKMEGYKQLRFKLKKAATKGRVSQEDRFEKNKLKQQKENILFKKPHKRVISIIKGIQQECLCTKLNEFSDKRFYEQNIRQRYRLHR